jgi:hypothetical protein
LDQKNVNKVALFLSQFGREARASSDWTYTGAFAEAVAWEDGSSDGSDTSTCDYMRRNFLAAFAATLSGKDNVVVEATGDAAAVASVIGPPIPCKFG